LEANKVEYRMEPVSPNDFINQAMEASSGLFIDSGLTLLADIEPDLPPVLGDKDRLIQVMVNLFSNSVKFTENGTITCHARRVGSHIRVSVIDTGIGMNDTLLNTIFDKFTQGNESLVDKPKGTGLGLPICRSIIESHSGHIWAESTLEKGSKFIFIMPIFQ
jgi:signal transduction histidine kinase